MRDDEELEHNVQIIATALLDVMHVLHKIEGCENRYIRDMVFTIFCRYGEKLKKISLPVEKEN